MQRDGGQGSSTPAVTIQAINFTPEPSGNGPYVGALARGLAAREFAVDVLTTPPHYPAWRIDPAFDVRTRTEDVHGARVRRLRHYVPRPPRGVRRLLSELSFGWRLLWTPRPRADVLVALHPALFSTWMWSWRQRRLPRIHWVQDIYLQGLSEIGEGGGLTARVTRFVESRTLRSAARIVVIHERFKTRLVELYDLDPERILVRRNWTYVKSVEPGADRDATRASLGWGDEVVVLYTGNFGAKQGLDVVVEAARLADRDVAPVRFALVGGGGEEAHLRALADAAPDGAPAAERVEFHGPQHPQDFSAMLAAADVLLVCEKPGVAESSVPSKLATYFGAGQPVLAVGSPDGITAEELALADAGVSIAAGDPAALLAAALDLGADAERSRRLGANGLDYHRRALEEQAALDAWAALVWEVWDERRSGVSSAVSR